MASIHKTSGHYSQGRYWSAPYGYKIHIGRSYNGLCGQLYPRMQKGFTLIMPDFLPVTELRINLSKCSMRKP